MPDKFELTNMTKSYLRRSIDATIAECERAVKQTGELCHESVKLNQQAKSYFSAQQNNYLIAIGQLRYMLEELKL